MQQPKGIAVVLGVLFGLLIVGAVVGGIFLFKGAAKNQPAILNTNTALQLNCSRDEDCTSYCGGDPNYQPICGVTTIGATGSCTCRSTSGSLVPTGNTNATTSTNVNSANSNVNASTNANTNSTVSTTSWKMYTNDEFSFRVQHPSDWAVTTATSNNARAIYMESSNGQDIVSLFPQGEFDVGLPSNQRTEQSTLGGKAVSRKIYWNTSASTPTYCHYTFSAVPAPSWVATSNRVQTNCVESEVLKAILSTLTFTK